jgi:hypothetical protein
MAGLKGAPSLVNFYLACSVKKDSVSSTEKDTVDNDIPQGNFAKIGFGLSLFKSC